MKELSAIVAALCAPESQGGVLATLVSVEGSSYRRPGARLLVSRAGGRIGSISGGCLEEDVMARAAKVQATGQPETVVYDTTSENDLVWGVGLGCQGIVQIFIERVPPTRPDWIATLRANLGERRATTLSVDYAGPTPRGTRLGETPSASDGIFNDTVSAPPALIICGAGDDAQPLARLAKEVGWHVTVADIRAAYATADRFPGTDLLIAASAGEIVRNLHFDARTFAVVMTHRYADDREFLRLLLPLEFPYLGQLGPRTRTNRLLAELKENGLASTQAQLAKLHAPVGLDLGGNMPETVSLAILAEMQTRLTGRTANSLRDQTGTIHD